MGWQQHYTPRPKWWQRILAAVVCGVTGHWWGKKECACCGMDAEQLN